MNNRNKLAKAIIESRSNLDYNDEMTEVLIKESLKGYERLASHRTTTFADRMADKLAHFAGSWGFLIVFTLVMIGWIVLNSFVFKNPFDPYPFILLNLFLSLISSVQAPIIMMSQNREAMIDRKHSEYEYKVNLKSEILLEEIFSQLEELRTEIAEIKSHTSSTKDQ